MTTLHSPPVIVVTNDDGVRAEGIQRLAKALAPLGDVYVVAPETEQSAASHALTLGRPLRLRTVSARWHALDGTPADCVYVALHHPGLLPRRPVLVASGINHGPNLGSDVFYSGTVAGAREGALRGVPAVAFSMAVGGVYGPAMRTARNIAARLIALRAVDPTPPPPLLNVNIPAGKVLGVRATLLGQRIYDDLVDVRTDPRGREYLWLGGANVTHPEIAGSDTEAYLQGCVSVTPLRMDLTESALQPLAEALTGKR